MVPSPVNCGSFFSFKNRTGLCLRGFRCLAESQGRLVLQFSDEPQGRKFHRFLPSIESFVNDYASLSKKKNAITSLSIMEDIQGQEQVVEFFLSLNATEDWTVTTASEVLVPFIITLFVPHTEDTKFLLHLGLEPGTENWLIHSLEIVSVG